MQGFQFLESWAWDKSDACPDPEQVNAFLNAKVDNLTLVDWWTI
jgi:hypothetical protein